MEKLKKVGLVLLLIALYLFGFALGLVSVCGVPMRKQIEHSENAVQTVADYWCSDREAAYEELTKLEGSNMRTLIYRNDGEIELHITPSNVEDPEKFTTNMAPLLKKVLKGKDVQSVRLAYETDRTIPDILIILGKPIYQNGQIYGAVFYIKNMMDVPHSIIGYMIYYTICYWAAAIVILLNLRRKKKLEQIRRNYVSNVTHALKTPIASIKALAETLCDGVETDPYKQQKCSAMILSEANRQTKMVKDILELSRLQSDDFKMTKSKIPAAELFDPIWEKYEILFECSNVELGISDNIQKLPELYTNADGIQQIMDVLLHNALKFSPEEDGKVIINASISGRKAIISVKDNGIGLNPADTKLIFERFYKGSHDFNESGNGIGLSIAREICLKLKERIWAEGAPGQGSEFFFTIQIK